MTLDQAAEYLHLFERRFGRKAVIYGGHELRDDLKDKVDPFFGSHRLWLAHHNTDTPKWQKSWSRYWLWQFTNTDVVVPGIRGGGYDGKEKRWKLDCNYYDGSRNELEAEWAT